MLEAPFGFVISDKITSYQNLLQLVLSSAGRHSSIISAARSSSCSEMINGGTSLTTFPFPAVNIRRPESRQASTRGEAETSSYIPIISPKPRTSLTCEFPPSLCIISSLKYSPFLETQAKKATEFISFSNSFHGRTMGALALTSKENYRFPFEPVMPGVNFLEYGDVQAATELIKSGRIAAVFVEPIQGEGGIYSATKEFLQSLRSACDDAGSLLVFDEVNCF